MTKDEILHLGKLSRIRLSETEVENFNQEIDAILDYVGAIKDMAGGETATEKRVGARFNIWRQDEITNEPESFTDALLAEMPKRQGRFLAVKKIIAQD